jgi:serine/threonine-protein kinase
MGTAGYMAPEQFTGRTQDPSLAPRIDVYALGCVLHACLTGEEPYPRDSYEQSMFAHVYEPPPIVSTRRPDVTTAMDAILARALAKDPRERYERATDLVRAVRAVADQAVSTDDEPTGVGLAATQLTAATPPTDAVPPPPERHRLTESATMPSPVGGEPTVVVPAAGPVGGGVPRRPSKRSGGPFGDRRLAIVVAGITIALAGVVALARPWEGDASGSSSPSPSGQAERSPTPTDRPTGSPTASPSPSPSPTPSPTAPSSGDVVYGSEADVADLVATLPADIQETCETYELYQPGAIAAVQCSRPEGGLIWYTRFADQATMQAAYDELVVSSGVTPEATDCGGGNECEQPWFFDADEQAIQGRILCSLASGAAFIEFTFDAGLTLATMIDSDGDLAGLYDEWTRPGLIPTAP